MSRSRDPRGCPVGRKRCFCCSGSRGQRRRLPMRTPEARPFGLFLAHEQAEEKRESEDDRMNREDRLFGDL